jgi:hypothetical protein
VIPGYELTRNDISNHRSAHVVALGVSEFFWGRRRRPRVDEEDPRPGRGLRRRASGLPRPPRKQTYHLWHRRKELESELDAWEVASGRNLFDEVLSSGLPMIANSDLHKPKHMTSWKTVLRCERHPEAVLRAIRHQDLRFHYYMDAAPDVLIQWEEAPGRRHPREAARAKVARTAA